jgi:hypothetical protein
LQDEQDRLHDEQGRLLYDQDRFITALVDNLQWSILIFYLPGINFTFRDVIEGPGGTLCTVQDISKQPGKKTFLFLNFFQKLKLECHHTVKRSVCCKFRENRSGGYVVGTNGLKLHHHLCTF